MTHPPLEIYLLGPVKILFEGKTLEINRRIERVILYLLAAQETPISRASIIDILWPNDDQLNTRRALRTALSRLRNELPIPDILRTELDQVWIDRQKCWIDLERFNTLYRSLQNVLTAFQDNRTLPIQIFDQTRAALDLWQGNTIIDGDDLTSYPRVDSWRHQLHHELNHARRFLTRRLAKHYQADGRLEDALDLFNQLGKSDPLDINLHLSVLDILISLGRHQDAIDYCDGLETLYEMTYNLPLPDQILTQYQYAQIQHKASQQQKPQPWPVSLSMQLQFVGRETELEQLRKAFYQGGLAVVSGENGMGKTRLVQELYQTLSPMPKLFLGNSIEIEKGMPLSPIIHGLRRHVAHDTWKKIDSIWASQISLMLPELAEIRDDLDPAKYSMLPQGKQYLFDALQHVFDVFVSQKGRLLFFLDDAQWVDQQTLHALTYITRNGFFDSHGLLVIAHRPEIVNPDLDDMINQLYRSVHITTVQVNGLSPDDLNLLVRQVLEKPPSMEFIAQLYRETNGNPFLALEIMRYILESSEDVESFKTHLPLPESILALIRKGMKIIPDEQQDILLCAAVIGGNFSAECLLTIADLDPDKDIDSLEPLVKSGLIRLNHEGVLNQENLQFGYEKVREVILEDTSPLRLQLLHKKIASYMEKDSNAKNKAAVIASHYKAGGESISAFDWFLIAAKSAWSLGAKESAIDAFQQAENILENAPDGIFTRDNFLQLYKDWSEFAYQANLRGMLEETGIKLQYFGEQTHDPLLLGFSQIAQANACFIRIKMDTALALIEKAIINLDKTDNRLALVQAIARKGACYWWKNQYDKTIQAAEKVIEICSSLADDSTDIISHHFFARHMIGMSRYAKGQADATLNYAQETYDQYYHKINVFNRMRMIQMMVYATLICADFHNCTQYSKKGIEIALALGNTFVHERLLMFLARAEIIQGHLDEAYHHANELLELAEGSGRTHMIVIANSLIGDIFALLGNHSSAIQYYRLGQIRSSTNAQSIQEIENKLHLARLLSVTGQLQEALDILFHSRQLTHQFGMMQLYSKALSISGFAEMIASNPDKAQEHFQNALQITTENGLGYDLTWAKLGISQILLTTGHFERSEELISSLFQDSQAINSTWQQLHALQLCAALHRETNKTTLVAYQSVYKQVMRELESHTQSDPLRKNFIHAKQLWDAGFQNPFTVSTFW